MAAAGNSRFKFAVVFVLFLCLSRVLSDIVQERQALLDFASQLRKKGRINWGDPAPVCSWFGVQCDEGNTFVYALRLPSSKLVGEIPPNTLGLLTQIRVLSLRSNGLYSTLPPDFAKLTFLRSLYLQGNWFSGGFPPPIVGFQRMNRLDLSYNQFSGPIPYNLNNLSLMNGFFMQHNQFSGELPSLNMPLVNFDASNNNLAGQIPDPLQRFPASAFAGNPGLCGTPLPLCG